MNLFTKKSKFTLLLCLVLIFASLNTFASVTISQATGGTISADKSAGSSADSFTTLGDIVISDNLTTDFTINKSKVTFVLSAPANWEFQPGTGTISFGGTTITEAFINVTSTDITVTFSTNNTAAADNSITIRGIAVRATSKAAMTAAAIKRTSGTSSIPGITSSTSFGALTQVAGNFVKLQVLLPGETAAPGTAAGKMGSPGAINAGTSFPVIVSGVDENWNVVSTVTHTVNLTTTDNNATTPASVALSSGTKSLTVTLRTPGSHTITVSDITNQSIPTVVSPAVAVNIGPFSKLQILLPGETAAPGTSTGKTGAPSPLTAGEPFFVTVNAVDAAFHPISTGTDIISITSTDVNANLPPAAALVAGTQTFSITLKTASSKTITASDLTDGTKASGTSPSITVNAAAFSKLQILLTGESSAPGTESGKTGIPTAKSTGSISATINAVDAYWNKVNTITDVVKLSSSDINATSNSAALVAGTKSISITIRTAGTHTLIVLDQTSGGISPANSSSLVVNVGSFSKLQVLLPGETGAPGSSTGKTGTASEATAGGSINITVNAVDTYWNIVTSANDVVKITSDDANAALPLNEALESGVGTFSVALKTAGLKTVTASDFTNATRKANKSSAISVEPAAFSQLQVILPGEQSSPGSLTGVTGTATAWTAGSQVSIIVNAVDAYFNKVPSIEDVMSISSSDLNASYSLSNAALLSGTGTYKVTFRTAGAATITAIDETSSTIKSVNRSGSVVPGTFKKLIVLLPGETAVPGTSAGKTGSPYPQIAGSPFDLTVNAVDSYGNLVNSVTDVVSLTSGDIYAILPSNASLSSGVRTFSVVSRTAGSNKITASDVTSGTKTAGSSTISISTGSLYALQIILPGETAAPGSPTGKKGNPNPPPRGTSFSVTVNAVDNCYNKISSVTNTITITSSDDVATLPSPSALSSGTRSFTGINLKTSGTQTLTATGASLSVTLPVEDNVASSNATDYFRSASSGNWDNSANWQSSVDGVSAWHAATAIPTSAAAAITILEEDTITIAANVSVDQLVVRTRAQLSVNSGVTLTVTDGADTDLDVFGVLNNAGIITTTGTFVVENGGKYQHAYTTSAGTIPTASWAPGSTCEIIGFTSATGTIGNANQNFYSLTWNCSGQNVSTGPSLGGAFSAVNFNIISTGTGTAQLATNGGIIAITGSYNQSGGKITLNNTSGMLNVNLSGDFNMTGGSLQKGSGTATVSFNGSSIQYFTNTFSTISGAIQFVVNPGATVDFDTYELDASSAGFALSSGATMYTAHPEGIASSGASGTIKTAIRDFSTGANFVYNGTEIQAIGTGLPTTFNNLTISNASGVSFPETSVTYTVAGKLNILSGSLDLGTNNLAAGTGFVNAGSGNLLTQSTAASPLPSGVIWTSNVYYNAPVDQTIVPATYKNLYFINGGLKRAASGSIIVIGDWISEDGDVDLLTNNVSVVFSGTTQSLNDATETGLSFKNLTFSNSGTKTLQSGIYTIANGGIINVTGSAVLNANGNLYINSDASGFGSIGPLTGGADITGNVNVRMFITGNNSSVYRGTRGISSPINDVGLVRKTFQQLKDYILITGPGNVSKGFDMGGTNVPDAVTLQTYSEPEYSGTSIFPALPDIYQSATPGKGYLAYFRGDRSNKENKVNAPFSATPEDVIVTFTGPVNKGPVTLSSLTNSHNTTPTYTATDPYNGYNLVGNPFASPINWQTILASSTNLDDVVVIVKAGGGTASYMNGIVNGGGSAYIQSGQAFYVKVKDSENAGSITFTESAKASAVSPGRLLSAPVRSKDILVNDVSTKVQSRVADQYSQLKLALNDAASEDETTIVLKSGASSSAEDDLPYFSGGSVSLSSLSSDNRNLAINFIPLPEQGTSIKLSVSATETKETSLIFKAFPEGYNVVLKDKYLNSEIHPSILSEYRFTIDKNVSATYGTNRFEVLLSPQVVLPLNLISFSARNTGATVQVSWATEKEQAIGHFEVQRASDSLSFVTLTRVEASNANSYKSYSFSDSNPLSGENYYRLKIVSVNGESSYSPIKNIRYFLERSGTNKLKIFPNPVSDKLTLNAPFIFTGGTVSVYTVAGLKIMSFTVTGGANQIVKDVRELPSGVYYIGFEDLGNKFVGSARFIKQ